MADASEAKNLTAPIISSTSPTLPILILDSIHFTFSGSLKVASVKGVLIKVGQTELTLILCGPNSMAIDLLIPSIACFVPQYTALSIPPT